MEYMILSAVLGVLWLTTTFLYIRANRTKTEKHLTVEAQDLLADMLSTGAVVRIEVLDPKNIFYHRGLK